METAILISALLAIAFSVLALLVWLFDKKAPRWQKIWVIITILAALSVGLSGLFDWWRMTHGK